MPISPQVHLKNPSNRCHLIVLSDSSLDETDCLECLALYGSITAIQLTSDHRAAFVDFECEHAPLLVAKLFQLYTRNPAIPMPSGVSMIMPGCSFNNYLFLSSVPRAVSSDAIRRYFGLNEDDIVYRPGTAEKPASRIVIQLARVKADSFVKKNIRQCTVIVKDKMRPFYAIPSIPQLTMFGNVCKTDGCDECNVVVYRESIELEDRMWKNGGYESDAQQSTDVSSPSNEDYRSSEELVVSLPSSSSLVEERRNGVDEMAPCTPRPRKTGFMQFFPSPKLAVPSLPPSSSLVEGLGNDMRELPPSTPKPRKSGFMQFFGSPTPPDPTQSMETSRLNQSLLSPSHNIPSLLSLSLDGYIPQLQFYERGQEISRAVGVQSEEEVIVEESKGTVNGREDVVIVEESIDSLHEEPVKMHMEESGEMKQASDVIVEESAMNGNEDGIVEKDVDKEERGGDERECSDSALAKEVVSENEEVRREKTRRLDSDDLLSGEEDEWNVDGVTASGPIRASAEGDDVRTLEEEKRGLKWMEEKRRKDEEEKWKESEEVRVKKADDEHFLRVDVHCKSTNGREEAGDWIEERSHEDEFTEKKQEWVVEVRRSRLEEGEELGRSERKKKGMEKKELKMEVDQRGEKEQVLSGDEEGRGEQAAELDSDDLLSEEEEQWNDDSRPSAEGIATALEQTEEVIVEESENTVNGKEDDVNVEESIDSRHEESVEMQVEESGEMKQALIDGEDDVIVEKEGEVKEDSDSEHSSDEKEERGEKMEEGVEMDSDDLHSGDEDQWKKVGHFALSSRSGTLSVSVCSISDDDEEKEEERRALADSSLLSMEVDEKVMDTVRDVVGRVDEMTCTASYVTVHEDTVSSRALSWASDEDTIDYDYDTVSEESAVSDASSDTVVGELTTHRMYPDNIFMDHLYGYRPQPMLSTIDEESQEGDSVSSVCSSDDVFTAGEREEEAMDIMEEDEVEKEVNVKEGRKMDGYQKKEEEEIDSDDEVEEERKQDTSSPLFSMFHSEGGKTRVLDSDDEVVEEMEDEGMKGEEKDGDHKMEKEAIDSDDEEEMLAKDEEGEQKDTVSSILAIPDTDGEKKRELDSDDEEMEEMEGGEEKEEEQTVATHSTALVSIPAISGSEQEEEKEEGEKQELAPPPIALKWRGGNEMDSDDEEEEERREEEGEGEVETEEEMESSAESEGEQPVIVQTPTSEGSCDARPNEDSEGQSEQREVSPSSTGRLWNRSEVDSDDEIDEGEEEKREVGLENSGEHLKEEEETGEGGVSVFIPSSINSVVVSKREDTKEGEEVEQRENVPSPSFDRWSRMSMVDEEEEERNRLSPYMEWLTREERTRTAQKDCGLDVVPLPSSLSTTTWGTGIAIEEKREGSPIDYEALLKEMDLILVDLQKKCLVRPSTCDRSIPTDSLENL